MIVGLVDDLLAVPDEEMNVPFKEWKKALDAWNDTGGDRVPGSRFGDDDAFDFLAERRRRASRCSARLPHA